MMKRFEVSPENITLVTVYKISNGDVVNYTGLNDGEDVVEELDGYAIYITPASICVSYDEAGPKDIHDIWTALNKSKLANYIADMEQAYNGACEVSVEPYTPAPTESTQTGPVRKVSVYIDYDNHPQEATLTDSAVLVYTGTGNPQQEDIKRLIGGAVGVLITATEAVKRLEGLIGGQLTDGDGLIVDFSKL